MSEDKKAKEMANEIFGEEEEKVVNTTEVYEEEEKDLEERDDVKEGMMAEADPISRISDPLKEHKGPAEDIVKKGLDGQLTALGRETATKLDAMPKHKVLIPVKELNPHDTTAVVGINGWNIQIKRGVPVILPDAVIGLLYDAGENPTLVR